jgi:7,8-dihydropterin-6-yl-methyl-4-(beta-D-ribofuranosyl)aminobenzene 5'-phosphate synthase
MDVRRGSTYALGGLGFLGAALIGGLSARFMRGQKRADQLWATGHYSKLKEVGAVKRLTILPLIDWYTINDPLLGGSPSQGQNGGTALAGEAGVSYLVLADKTTILFDVGLNGPGEHPSPLLHNMQALEVDLGDVDSIVISHLHLDHVGGMQNQRQRTFALSGEPVPLDDIPAFVPVPMTHPAAQVEVVDGPRVIAPGVASLGPIDRQLFFLGWTPEQSLAVNVEGKGIVLIIGCGHSTLKRIIDRAEMLFDEPIYGLVGGLHYPVTASRSIRFGLPMQRVLGTGKWPWDPINPADVEAAISYLQLRQPQLVSLSAHDSCDWSLNAFRGAFDGVYQELLVGKEIIVA